MAGLENLLKLTKKNFSKRRKDTDLEFVPAKDLPPLDGLILDNPLQEYIFDRRFVPYGRMALAYGKGSSSKTSFFFDMAKLFQRHGGVVVWVETENAADLNYAVKQGVDIERLVLQHPRTIDEGLDLIVSYINALPDAYPERDVPFLICLDSIGGSVTEYETDDDIAMGEQQVGRHAKLMSQFYALIEEPLARERAFFLATNQLKDKIPKPGEMTWGGPGEALKGGEAQLYHSTFRWKLSKVEEMMAKNEQGADRKIGSIHRIEVKRNKVGREGKGQVVQVDNYIRGGFDWYSPLARFLGENYPALIKKEGGWFTWNIPETPFNLGEESGVIPIDKRLRDRDLGRLIYGSPHAKELIRKSFEIPDIASQEEVQDLHEKLKEKRKIAKRRKIEKEEL
jgi:RecA/RadA recombinase